MSKDGEGLLVVISGPSGGGKTTVVSGLLEKHPQWRRSVSVTTRSPREGEVDGRDYFFVEEDRFRELQGSGGLLESAQVFGKHYGTPRDFVDQATVRGEVVILTIDVQGAEQVKASYEKELLFSIFILPPDEKTLEERLRNRKTDQADEIEKRLKIAVEEMRLAGRYDFQVVNSDLSQTIEEIERAILNRLKGGKT